MVTRQTNCHCGRPNGSGAGQQYRREERRSFHLSVSDAATVREVVRL